MRTTTAALVLSCCTLLGSACGDGLIGELTDDELVSSAESALELAATLACQPPASPGKAGEALAGLSAALQARFAAGLEEFGADETPEEGLGPVFNDTACARCHTAGGIGGASDRTVTRFGHRNADGSFDPLGARGGSLIQKQGITFNGCTQPPETVPPEANVTTARLTTPLFGLGLLDAVPESSLLALADPRDRDGDGISGRANVVDDPSTGRTALGRFGWKAQNPSIFVFAGDAYLNEMGITNTLFPHENLPDGAPATCDDGLPGDAIDDEDADGNGVSDGVERFTDFMRLLGPPPTAGPATREVQRGASLFARVGCATCHRPALRTGTVADVPQLSRRTFFPFTDLLLHDMGTLGDGIVQGQATGSELRTAPLWGLRLRRPYLHDGRAATVADAIAAHQGEGERSRRAFQALRAADQADLLAFLAFL